ncbi:unnamed protein product [Phytophthora lilii]|uniref:Unnamed protein product n=1 Tax=Phytophthora lilii TaxID=2077276 RepID=A0A9W6WI96_9STRA|nr:unnamed protein product [Phytophthora lilii]
MASEGTSPGAQASSKTKAKPKSELAKPKDHASHQQGAAAAAQSPESSSAPPDIGENPRDAEDKVSKPTGDKSSPGLKEVDSKGVPGDGDTKAASAKHLTLAEGRERARAKLAARFAVTKDKGDSEQVLITNHLDQQERYQAALASAHPAVPSAGGVHQASGDSVHAGLHPPDDSTDDSRFLESLRVPCPLVGGHISKGAYERAVVQNEPLFVSDVEAARCVLLALHKIPLKAFTSHRKKPENEGGLHPVWGYPWGDPTPEEVFFWRWISLQGYAAQELQKLRDEQQLSSILEQREPRITFAHLVGKRQLQSELARLAHPAQSGAPAERGQLGAAQSASKCFVKTDSPATSLGAGALLSSAASREPAPHGSGVLRFGQEAPVAASLDPSFEPSSSTTVALRRSSAPQAQPVSLQQEEIRLLCERVYALEIALGLGPGGQAAAQSSKLGALADLRHQIGGLHREVRDLHGRVAHRERASTLTPSGGLLSGGSPSSRRPPGSTATSGAAAVCGYSPAHGAKSAESEWRPAPETQSRFEEVSSPPRGYPPLPPQGSGPAIMISLQTTHIKCRVGRHRLRYVDCVGSAVPTKDCEGSNEAVLQFVAPHGANSVGS